MSSDPGVVDCSVTNDCSKACLVVGLSTKPDPTVASRSDVVFSSLDNASEPVPEAVVAND